MARRNHAGALVLVGLGLLSFPLAGLPARPGMPVPAAGARVATVGPGSRDFATLREALRSVPPGSVLELAGAVFTEGEIEVTRDVFLRGSAGGRPSSRPPPPGRRPRSGSCGSRRG